MVNGKIFCFITLLFLCFNNINSSGLVYDDFDICKEISIDDSDKRKDANFADCISRTPSEGYRCCAVSHKVSKDISDTNRWHHSCELFIKDASFIKHYKKNVALKDVHIECGSKYLSVAIIFLISLLIF